MPADDGWVDAIAFDELRDGRATRIGLDGEVVLLYRNGDDLFAIGNRCTHQGAPLDKGVVRVAGSQRTVTCPAHGSMFSLVDGSVVRGPAHAPVPACDVQVVAGMVRLRWREARQTSD
jgi:nitrite reductase/ring-hydroxylating ferredoxin subunit